VQGKEEVRAGGINVRNVVINNLKEDVKVRGTTVIGFARLFL
jgi:hypothetical protein